MTMEEEKNEEIKVQEWIVMFDGKIKQSEKIIEVNNESKIKSL